jgi:hypothetical protein
MGKEIGKGGAARVYADSTNPNIAIKIFHDFIIQKEKNLLLRLKKLYELSQIVGEYLVTCTTIASTNEIANNDVLIILNSG